MGDNQLLIKVSAAALNNNDFNKLHNFTVFFNSTDSNAYIFIDGTQVAQTSVCTNTTQISAVNFSRQGGEATVKNNLFTANNKLPEFIGNLPNITWPEDTSTDFNISGNFSDSNSDTLTYTYTDVNNISISINNNSGIVNPI